MQLTGIFILACLMQASASTSAQTVSLHKKEASLKEVLMDIRSQTDYNFIYSNKTLKEAPRVSISANYLDLNEVLEKIFDRSNITYSIRNKVIVLKEKERKSTKKEVPPLKVEEAPVHPVTGQVTDSTTGEPLAGVTIRIKGKSTGAVTDGSGQFTLEADDDDVLQLSFVGYDNKEVGVQQQSSFNIQLVPSSTDLNQLVVVGYGTQKKANLTGAVDQVGDEFIENRPMPNVTQGLQGVIPNLNINLADGKPSRTADFQVRGLGSIGQGGSALVLIDGVEGDPAMINPNDIESISVLKDASAAAIYGARGAFGVVLITTKHPERGRTSVTYSANLSLRKPTRIPKNVTDGYIHGKMFQEAYSSYYDYSRTPSDFHRANSFSESWLEEMANRRPGSGKPEVEVDDKGNYVYYANFDWFNELFKSETWGHDHNLSIQGGTDKADFFVSGRFYKQDGLYRYNSDDYNTYSIRAKGSAQITDWLRVSNNSNLSQRQYHYPHVVGDGNIWYRMINEGQPMSPLFNPDGTLTNAGASSVGDMWYGKNGMDTKTRILRNTTSISTSFFDDVLQINGDITFRNTDEEDQFRRVPVPFSPGPDKVEYEGSATNDFSVTNASTNYLAVNVYGQYENTFNLKHYFKGMIGYNYEQSTFNTLTVRRNGLAFPDADNINLASGGTINLSSNYQRWRIAGGFFRLNYSYDDRYLLEVDGRVDGSSKFPKDEQVGFFPSVSAGWRLSQEPFWNIGEVFNDLKLRASYGSLGNGNVGPYTFMELFQLSQMTRLIGGELKQMTSSPGVVPDGLTWETSRTADIGLDMTTLKGRLNFSGDYYVRKTKDMFAVGLDLPQVFGATPPKGNYADMTTKGWEISVSWRDQFDLGNAPFRYNVRFTLADYTGKIDRYVNPEKEIGSNIDGNTAKTNYYEGMRLGEIWGYVTEGFFTSEKDIEEHASQKLYSASATSTWLPGDIKFKDLNGDGVIDHGTDKVGDPGDQKIIGNSTPRYSYGLNLGADWKGFYFSSFFQGIGKQDWWPGVDNGLFWGQYSRPYGNVPISMLNEIWSEDNPNTYFPRYRGYVALQGRRELAVPQTKYLQNVAYIRLKNLQVGYHLPEGLLNSLNLQKASVYVSADNLWTWSPLYKHTDNFDVGNIYGEDQESAKVDSDGGSNSIISSGGQTYNYPILTTISVGLSVTF